MFVLPFASEFFLGGGTGVGSQPLSNAHPVPESFKPPVLSLILADTLSGQRL